MIIEKTIKLWKVGRKVLPTSDVASRFVAAEGRIPTIKTSRWCRVEDDQSASYYDDYDDDDDDRSVGDVDRLLPPPPSRAATGYSCNSSGSGSSSSNSPTHRLHPYCRNVFADAHTYHINSLSCCMDGQTFLSADDLRIYWWHLDKSDTCFSKSPSIEYCSVVQGKHNHRHLQYHAVPSSDVIYAIVLMLD